MYLYSALFVVPHTQGAQAWITQCYLQLHQCLPLSVTTVKFGVKDSLLHAKFGRNCLMGYTPFWQIYTKNVNFGDLGGCGPTCLKPQQ